MVANTNGDSERKERATMIEKKLNDVNVLKNHWTGKASFDNFKDEHPDGLELYQIVMDEDSGDLFVFREKNPFVVYLQFKDDIVVGEILGVNGAPLMNSSITRSLNDADMPTRIADAVRCMFARASWHAADDDIIKTLKRDIIELIPEDIDNNGGFAADAYRLSSRYPDSFDGVGEPVPFPPDVPDSYYADDDEWDEEEGRDIGIFYGWVLRMAFGIPELRDDWYGDAVDAAVLTDPFIDKDRFDNDWLAGYDAGRSTGIIMGMVHVLFNKLESTPEQIAQQLYLPVETVYSIIGRL